MDRPEVVPTRSALDRFSRSDQRAFRAMAANDCLHLHRSAGVAGAAVLEAVAA